MDIVTYIVAITTENHCWTCSWVSLKCEEYPEELSLVAEAETVAEADVLILASKLRVRDNGMSTIKLAWKSRSKLEQILHCAHWDRY